MRRLRLLVCHHYIQETRAALDAAGITGVRVGSYPARCVQPSSLLTDAEREALSRFSQREPNEDLIVFGFCCVGQAAGVLEALSATDVHQLDSCFSLFVHSEHVRRLQASGGYVMTPGWLEQWRLRLREWGFDQPTARDFFAESAQRLVLLDTGVYPNTRRHLAELAEYLELPFEVFRCGLEIMHLHLEKVVLNWRRNWAEESSERADARLAEYAMAFELLTDLTHIMGEEEATATIRDIFTMLTGARQVQFLDAGPGDRDASLAPDLRDALAGMGQSETFASLDDGFLLPVRFRSEFFGTLLVRDLPLPERVGDYVNLGLAIVNLCGLALANARAESARRRAEQELVDKARELERSNADLTQFAYSVSHDLQEPLVTVVGFLQLLEARFAGELSPGAVRYVHQAVEGTQRMDRFIQDLLKYSRAGTRAITLLPVDLNAVLSETLKGLEGAIGKAGATIEVPEPLPYVLGNAGLLSQLLQNLISNAIKYRKDVAPVIRIEGRRQFEMWEFSVTDNGIGFEPKDADRIFRVFQRLGSRKKVAGTGIGLALCRRVVERHEGTIWATSTPGQGSTFHFTLVAAEPTRENA